MMYDGQPVAVVEAAAAAAAAVGYVEKEACNLGQPSKQRLKGSSLTGNRKSNSRLTSERVPLPEGSS